MTELTLLPKERLQALWNWNWDENGGDNSDAFLLR